MTTPPVTCVSRATALAQEVDDGLSPHELVELVDHFTTHPTKAEAYLTLGETVRRIWTRTQLAGGVQQGS